MVGWLTVNGGHFCCAWPCTNWGPTVDLYRVVLVSFSILVSSIVTVNILSWLFVYITALVTCYQMVANLYQIPHCQSGGLHIPNSSNNTTRNIIPAKMDKK